MTHRESEPERDPFRLLADNAVDLIYICRLTPSFSCEYISPSCLAITGYHPQEFYDDPQLGFKLVHPDDMEVVVNNLQACHETHSSSIRWFHRDGRMINLEVRQTPGIDAGGNIHSIYGIARDVTAQLKTARELEEAGRLKNAIFQQAPAGVALTDSRSGRFLEVNPAFCRMTGYSREELLELTFMRITHPDDLARDVESMDSMLAGKLRGYKTQKRYVKKGGETAWVNLTVAPMWEEGETPTRNIAIAEDVTAVKMAEEEVARTNQRFRAMFHDSPIGAELYGHAGQLLEANRACLDIFGVEDIGHVRGFRLFEDPNITGERKDAIRNGQVVKYESEFDFGRVIEKGLYPTSKRGKIWIHATISPIASGNGGGAAYYLVQVEDITGRRNMDAAKDSLRRAKEYFTTVTAHELRTPLVALQLAMALLDEAKVIRSPGPLMAKAYSAIGRAFANLEKIATSTQALNDLFFMKSSLETKSVPIMPPLQRAADAVRSGILRAGRKVDIIQEADVAFCAAQVLADPDLLTKALNEAISNAVKFSHDGGTVRLVGAAESGHAVVRVTDEGEGLSGEELEELGEPYFSTRDPKKHFTGGYAKGGGGIGLGLAVIKVVISAFGGSVALESPGKGKGSTLTIRLPLA